MSCKYVLLRGVFFMPLFLIYSCGNTHSEKKSNPISSINFPVTTIPATPVDSFQLDLPDSNLDLNIDIPIKLLDSSLYFLSRNHQLLEYNRKSHELRSIIDLSAFKRPIHDYYIINKDSLVLFNNEKGGFLYKTGENSYKSIFNSKDFEWNTFPFLGVELIPFKNKFLSPHVKLSDYNSNCFLGLWSKEFDYIKGIGEFDYMAQSCRTAFYYTPAYSNVFNDNNIAVGPTSENNITIYKINDSLDLVPETSYSFPELPEIECISDHLMQDLKFQSKLYITSSYWCRISCTSDKIFRIAKLNQDYVNSSTNRINRIMDSEWLLYTIDLTKKEIRKRGFKPAQFDYLFGFTDDQKIYIPKVKNDKIILYAFD